MQPVKIKNINKSYMKKPFVVKGRVKFCEVLQNKNSTEHFHLNAIIFDNISEIEVVAFKSCQTFAEKLPKDSVVMIEHGALREVNKDYKKTKHKYQIILQEISLITLIDNDTVNINDFPLHKYTSGADLITLTTGMIIDVIGVCTHIDSEKTFNSQQQPIRKANISVDSVQIEVRFSGDKVDEIYYVGTTLYLHIVKYINYSGFIYLSVGDSSFVQCNTQQSSNGMDTKQLQQLETVKKFCQDSTIELPDQKPSISSITQSNNKSTIESPKQRLSTSSVTQSYKNLVDESIDERPSTSGSTPSNKRKTHDFKVEEVSPKIPKKTESDEAFSDVRFANMVINFMQMFNNNKRVVQLSILEFISNMLKEDEDN